jgi:hypothetical protein
MPWKAITALDGCGAVTPPNNHAQLFVFRTSVDNTGWLIGPYKELTRFATELRHQQELRDFLSHNRIRIGLRSTDVPPPNVARQRSYGALVPGDNCAKDFTAGRMNPVALPVCANEVPPINRKTDREENTKAFWETQTPQSHHIVEFNNLRTLGVSTEHGNEGMDYFHLPAVLLAAEFHQRYISAILKPAHQWKKVELQSKIGMTYRNLYTQRSKLFEPLWLVSKAILQKGGIQP